MILCDAAFAPTLAGLTATLTARAVETWTFDDTATRRAAEAAFAARGIKACCHSAYKPLVCAFRDRIDTEGLVRAQITFPRHPDAAPTRFLLESYPLPALLPSVAFAFAEGAETRDLPAYHLHLAYADGCEVTRTVLAPNRCHADYTGEATLSPCGWLVADAAPRRLVTEYEALFHAAMQAIETGPWQAEPYFEELNITATLPVADEDLGIGDEVLSLREALHEDLYFSALEVFQRRSGRPIGDRHLQPGQIVPEIRLGRDHGLRVETRPYDATSLTHHVEPLETAGRALSIPRIEAELARIPGQRYGARSVAGRAITAVHHPGTDRGVIISAGQHANETTAPVAALRAVNRLLAREGAHFACCPLENPDGYALHQRLVADNPRHMHHAARYTALGDDLEYREGPALHEASIRAQAEARVPALLHLNIHGYPAHEWTRPLSGYVPRGFGTWTIPKGFFLIMRHRTGWQPAAEALMDGVTRRLDAVPGLRAFNDAQRALFSRHAGDPGFRVLNGFAVLIGVDDRPRMPLTLMTEYPDETIHGDAFRAGHGAQMAAILAGYEALQALPASLLAGPPGA